jgi:putative nucleotidyltransferase with HDIG domain
VSAKPKAPNEFGQQRQPGSWAESVHMTLPGGNFTLTLTMEPSAPSPASSSGLMSMDDLPDLFSRVLDFLPLNQRPRLNLSPPPPVQKDPASLFYWASSLLKQLNQGNGKDEFSLQLLKLVAKITKVRQGAFFTPNGVHGALKVLISLDHRNLPSSYWDAAREVARDGYPRFYHPREQEAPILAVPVAPGGEFHGVLLISDRSERPLDQDDLNLVTMLAENPSLVSDNLALQEKNTIYLLESIKALVRTLEARDPYTGQHSARVTEIVAHFGRFLGLPAEEVESLKTASYLHDIGKVGISDFILLKPGPLTQEERVTIETHPLIGGKIVEPLGLRPRQKDIILYHHERWDGRGYPYGLAGEEIPFYSRMLALADVYDALTTDRPYRRRWGISEALAEIEAHAGTQFDPHLASEFVNMLSSQAA